MSLPIEVTIARDTATPAVQALIAALQPEELARTTGPDCVALTKDHLAAYRNRKGWPSIGLGEELANATYWAATAQGLVITIHGQAIRQIYKGGHIPRTPTGKRVLIFAISPESYGKTMAEMGYRPKKDGGDAANNKRIRALFAFVDQRKGVNQPPHPEIIPTPEQYSQTAIGAIINRLRATFST